MLNICRHVRECGCLFGDIPHSHLTPLLTYGSYLFIYLFINICSSKRIAGPPFVGNVFHMLLCCRMELWTKHISKLGKAWHRSIRFFFFFFPFFFFSALDIISCRREARQHDVCSPPPKKKKKILQRTTNNMAPPSTIPPKC
jgi:hypothetical protein